MPSYILLFAMVYPPTQIFIIKYLKYTEKLEEKYMNSYMPTYHLASALVIFLLGLHFGGVFVHWLNCSELQKFAGFKCKCEDLICLEAIE